MDDEPTSHRKVNDWLKSIYPPKKRRQSIIGNEGCDRPSKHPRPAARQALSPPVTDPGPRNAQDLAHQTMDQDDVFDTPRVRQQFQRRAPSRSSPSHHSSLSSGSRKRSTDSWASNSSPTKQLRTAGFSSSGFTRKIFSSESNPTLPPDFQQVLKQLRCIGRGQLGLPCEWKDTVAAAIDVPEAFFRQTPQTSSLSEPCVQPPKSTSGDSFAKFVRKIARAARACNLDGEPETVWTDKVYRPILEWACNPGDEDKETLVQCHCSTSCKILPEFRSDTSSHMVDYCLVFDDEQPAVKQNIQRVCASRPSMSINHTNAGSLCRSSSRIPAAMRKKGCFSWVRGMLPSGGP